MGLALPTSALGLSAVGLSQPIDSNVNERARTREGVFMMGAPEHDSRAPADSHFRDSVIR
jgi:hypothetical protein